MNRKAKIALFVPLGIAGIALFVALGGLAVKLLWNALLPGLFGWPAVGFWQALGLLALCRILFGGFGGGGPRSRMRRRMAERCEPMTPEERERLARKLHERWGDERPRDPQGA